MLHVCYASSDYYARETGISMIGFLENNREYAPQEIFILDYGILPNNIKKLNDIAGQYGKRVTYLPAKQILEKLQTQLNIKDFRGSLATYSRAFIDKIMPDYVDRLLYIDSDTVVVDSCQELNDFDLAGACMAGIQTPIFTSQIQNGVFKLYTGNLNYYGCGIVLFDLKRWREINCHRLIVDMLAIKREYPCADQTLINNAIPEQYLRKLPLKYNYTTHMLSKAVERYKLRLGNCYNEKEIYEAVSSPVVVHYAGLSIGRPWYEGCISRCGHFYYKYKKQSPWCNDDLYVIEAKLPKGIKAKIGACIQKQEYTATTMVWLKVVYVVRNVFGNVLRILGCIPKLPNEGIE